MPNGNWKCLALLCAIAALAASLLLLNFSGLLAIPANGWLLFAVLLALTIAAGRFTVPVTDADGGEQGHKSIADAFIFLTAMLYGAAPAALLAGADSFNTSRNSGRHTRLAYSTATGIASTLIAV